jgi:hypothetical protein
MLQEGARQSQWPAAGRQLPLTSIEEPGILLKGKEYHIMLRLHVIQARYGDCFILEYGTGAQARYMLIDGGPARTYEANLRGKLQNIEADGGQLDFVVLSHVDRDHITGLLDLTSELRQQRANDEAVTITINALWHNAFEDSIGHETDIEGQLQSLLATAGVASQVLANAGKSVLGIGEGRQLRRDASLLGIPVNPEFGSELITVDTAPTPLVLANLTVRVVGPTQDNLRELREEWQTWLDDHADDIASGDPLLAAMADDRAPNLSSIMLLVEAEGKRLLLTGDGRGDHLLQGLAQAGLLDDEGCIHVDLFKLPHHGSDRNATRQFFRTVTADQYVVSADGLHGNPDLVTFIWLVEAAKKHGRDIEIIVTNETESSRKLLQEYDPDEYGYRLTTLGEGKHALTIDLAPSA